jgi:phosphatidylglycerol lysyltransferase
MQTRIIQGAEATSLGREEKWRLLSPFVKRYGDQALSYATLQEGMEYFVHPTGYVAFASVIHPVFARRGRRIVLSDPLCAEEDLPGLVRAFLDFAPHAAFVVVSERCATVLRGMGFKANCVGYESEVPVQTYNTQGNWKELDLVKRARNEAKREGIVIREETIEKVSRKQLDEVTGRWIAHKKVNDREIWIYARRPVFEHEDDVRKFVAYDRDGRVAGFVFYDPIYSDGRVFGYAANISRCDEQRFGRLATAVNMVAAEQFKAEGKETLNLMLAPFSKLDGGKYNDDWLTKLFFQVTERFGNNIYNFKGLSFHKAKYRGAEKPLYFASNNPMPSNDVYLAFLSSDITRSYFSTMGRLLAGVVAGLFGKSRT